MSCVGSVELAALLCMASLAPIWRALTWHCLRLKLCCDCAGLTGFAGTGHRASDTFATSAAPAASHRPLCSPNALPLPGFLLCLVRRARVGGSESACSSANDGECPPCVGGPQQWPLRLFARRPGLAGARQSPHRRGHLKKAYLWMNQSLLLYQHPLRSQETGWSWRTTRMLESGLCQHINFWESDVSRDMSSRQCCVATR